MVITLLRENYPADDGNRKTVHSQSNCQEDDVKQTHDGIYLSDSCILAAKIQKKPQITPIITDKILSLHQEN